MSLKNPMVTVRLSTAAIEKYRQLHETVDREQEIINAARLRQDAAIKEAQEFLIAHDKLDVRGCWTIDPTYLEGHGVLYAVSPKWDEQTQTPEKRSLN